MKYKTRQKTKYKSLIALALLLCVLFTPLFSSVYIISHANHRHNYAEPDGSCTVCVHLQSAENALKLTGASVKNVSGMAAVLLSSLAIIYVFTSFYGCQTLVTLKTRMDS
ncbi:MAG: hypothetical protein LBI54_07680 [Lachnospiraceae bacterium]|nr:hypothetical protein [Lachnospiraceae bacterium]